MAVSTTVVRSGPYTTNGVTTAFPFSFIAMSEEEVRVFTIDSDDNEATIAGYTVALSGSGGTVTFATAPPAGNPLYIEANPDFTSDLTLEQNGPFLPDVISAAFDRSAARDLVLRDLMGRAILAPVGQAGQVLSLAGLSGLLLGVSAGAIVGVTPPGNVGLAAFDLSNVNPAAAALNLGFRRLATQAVELWWNESTGSDANPGTMAAPYATFAAAYAALMKSYDFALGYPVTIATTKTGTLTQQIAVKGRLPGLTAVDQFVIQGPGPTLATINPGGTTQPFSAFDDAWCKLDGFTLANATATDHLMKSYLGARVYKGAVNFGAVAAGYFDMQAADGYILCVADWSTTGNKGGVGVSEVGDGRIDLGFNPATGMSWHLTFVGNPAYSLAAFNAGEGSYIDLSVNLSASGSFTGAPWDVEPTGELGQDDTSRDTLQALTTTPGIWRGTQFSQVVIGAPNALVYNTSAQLVVVGPAGEAAVNPIAPVMLALSNNGNVGLSLNGSATGQASIYAGKAGFGNNDAGELRYDFTADTWRVLTGQTERVDISAAGLNLLTGGFKIAGTSVLSGVQAGYGAPTGGARQSSFVASTITLPNLAAAVAQLILDLEAGKMPAA